MANTKAENQQLLLSVFQTPKEDRTLQETEEGQGQRLRRPPEVGSEWTLAKPQGQGLRAGLMTGGSRQDLAGATRGHSRSR